MTANKSHDTPEELFQAWLGYMPAALDEFVAQMPVDVRPRLDFTPASLDALEAWALSRYSTIAQLRAPEQVHLLDGLARYVGETYRKELGGDWHIRFDNPKDAYHGLPELRFSIPVPPLCPHRLITASIDRRTGKYLRTILSNSKELHQSARNAA